MDVLILGGGVIGLASACALAAEGHAVQIVERERTGSRASWVAAGLLTPSSPWRYPRALIDLCHRGEAAWPAFAEQLERHTGIGCELETGGMLYPEGVTSPAAVVAEQARWRNELGFGVTRLSRAEALEKVPGLGPAVGGAAWLPRSSRLRPPRLLAALRRRAQQLGVSILEQCAVAGLLVVRGAVTGLRLASGQELGGDVVVLAAGAWSGLLGESAGLSLAVAPVRGQMLLLSGPPGLLWPVVNDGDCYLVPRRDGRILVGSTMEDVGFSAVVTDAAREKLRRLAATLLPATAGLPEEMAWAGLRPATLDRLPYLGWAEGVPGLLLATGHFRNGILLAPGTATLVADLVAGRAPEVDLSPFGCREVDPQASLMTA